MSIYQTTDIIPRTNKPVPPLVYRVVLTNHKDFEEVILDRADTRKEAYDAYKAWFSEYLADPAARRYPADVWAVCTRAGEVSWKTNPFIGTGKA